MLIESIRFEHTQEVLTILRKFDDDFNPKFSLSVNLLQYAEKLAIYAHMLKLSEDDEVIGCCFYYENVNERDIYITYFCVKSAYRGRGYSVQMIDFIIKKYTGTYTTITLEVRMDNKLAIRFYEKSGFRILDTNNNKYQMQKKIV